MHTFYHITPAKNVSLILKHGLTPNIGDRSSKLETENGIYLFNTLDDVDNALMNWLSDEFDEDEVLSLLSITLPIEPDVNHYETVVRNPIPASAIKLVKSNVDESANPTFSHFIKTAYGK